MSPANKPYETASRAKDEHQYFPFIQHIPKTLNGECHSVESQKEVVESILGGGRAAIDGPECTDKMGDRATWNNNL